MMQTLLTFLFETNLATHVKLETVLDQIVYGIFFNLQMFTWNEPFRLLLTFFR